jgi:hypothetical protein
MVTNVAATLVARCVKGRLPNTAFLGEVALQSGEIQ